MSARRDAFGLWSCGPGFDPHFHSLLTSLCSLEFFIDIKLDDMYHCVSPKTGLLPLCSSGSEKRLGSDEHYDSYLVLDLEILHSTTDAWYSYQDLDELSNFGSQLFLKCSNKIQVCFYNLLRSIVPNGNGTQMACPQSNQRTRTCVLMKQTNLIDNSGKLKFLWKSKFLCG